MRRIQIFLVISILAIGLTGVATAALPTQVNAKITHTGGTGMPTTASCYWNVLVNSQVPLEADLVPGPYPGWCVDSLHVINSGTYDFTVYSSLDPAGMEADSYLTTIADGNWKKINYILNHKGVANNNARAIQAAIWHYDGGVMPSGYSTWDDSDEYDDLISAADTYGGSFVPTYQELYAVVIVPPDLNNERQQICLIEVMVPTTVTVPEFPIMALPAGMLIGMVFVVSMLRRRT